MPDLIQTVALSQCTFYVDRWTKKKLEKKSYKVCDCVWCTQGGRMLLSSV